MGARWLVGGAICLALIAVPRGGGATANGATARATPTPTPTPAPLVQLPFVQTATPTPTPTPRPAVTPPPDLQPARLAVGQVRVTGSGFNFVLSARGGTISEIQVALRRAERTVRAVRIASLSGSRRLTLVPRGGLKPGDYTVRVMVADVIAVDRLVAVGH